MKTLKKYANRKLYCKDLKKYVTLTYVYDALRAGESVQVVTHDDGKDITDETIRSAIMNASEVTTDKLLDMVRDV